MIVVTVCVCAVVVVVVVNDSVGRVVIRSSAVLSWRARGSAACYYAYLMLCYYSLTTHPVQLGRPFFQLTANTLPVKYPGRYMAGRPIIIDLVHRFF